MVGVVAVAALLRCPSGPGAFGSCFTSATAVLSGTSSVEATEDPIAAPAAPLAAQPAASPQRAQRRNEAIAWTDIVIAETFEKLPAEPKGGRPFAIARKQEPAMSTESVVEAVDTSITGSVRVQAVARIAQTTLPAAPAGSISLIEAVEPRPRIDDSRRVAAADAAPDGESWVVGGAGVTVRSGPSKTKARLFALAAGKVVTVSDRERGWLRVTDEKGRSGWAYSSFLKQR